MTELFTLFSSSAGNCACLYSQGTALLVDAGGTCKKILTGLQAHGVDPSMLAGIVLTHEHIDHVAALRVLLRRCPVPVYGTPATLSYIADNDLVPADAMLCPVPSDGVGGMIGDIAFETFPTLHDACDTCGYTFTAPDGVRIGYATDLGRFTGVVCDNLAGCDIVVLESNYDPAMLAASAYPYRLIRRIRGDMGHLSNDDCAAAVSALAARGTRRFILAHTSKENNFEELAYQTTRAALEACGAVADVVLEVAPKFGPSPVVAV